MKENDQHAMIASFAIRIGHSSNRYEYNFDFELFSLSKNRDERFYFDCCSKTFSYLEKVEKNQLH